MLLLMILMVCECCLVESYAMLCGTVANASLCKFYGSGDSGFVEVVVFVIEKCSLCDLINARGK